MGERTFFVEAIDTTEAGDSATGSVALFLAGDSQSCAAFLSSARASCVELELELELEIQAAAGVGSSTFTGDAALLCLYCIATLKTASLTFIPVLICLFLL